jgi:SMI1/KNR4 family protein SUKH-1
MDLVTLARALDKPPGATLAALTALEAQVGAHFPEDYRAFVQSTNGAEGPVGEGYLSMWPVEEIALLNEQYEVAAFVPGLVVFATDGGNTGYAVDTTSHAIVEISLIGMSREGLVPRGRTLRDLLEFISQPSD